MASKFILEVNFYSRGQKVYFTVKNYFSGQTLVSKSIFILKVKIYSRDRNSFFGSNLDFAAEIDFEIKICFHGPRSMLKVKIYSF